MIDGVYSNSRKIFILTTNELQINNNLISRPSRIRYIKEFNGVTELAITQIIKDKLVDKSLEDKVRDDISNLVFNSIDIVDNIICEYNIHGNTIRDAFNIPNKREKFSLLYFNITNRYSGESLIDIEDILKVRKFLKPEKFEAIRKSGLQLNLLEGIKEDIIKKYDLEKILEYCEEEDIKSVTIDNFIDFWLYTEKNIDVGNTSISSDIYIAEMKSLFPQLYECLKVELFYDEYIITEIKEGVIKIKRIEDESEIIRFGILL